MGPRRLISTCNIAACIATSSPSSPGYYAPPLSTPLIPRPAASDRRPRPFHRPVCLASFWTSKAVCLLSHNPYDDHALGAWEVGPKVRCVAAVTGYLDWLRPAGRQRLQQQNMLEPDDFTSWTPAFYSQGPCLR